ncbi:MAG TPA: hypothetical protein VGR35_15550 [Tepidisphaeraceae bacterium]|nr:hypothetical protein [Tepidisphaeraceae bacterium]
MLHPLDELPVVVHQPLLCLDLGDDLTLAAEGREPHIRGELTAGPTPS